MKTRSAGSLIVLVLSAAALASTAAVVESRSTAEAAAPNGSRVLCDALLAELEAEAATTARVLERIPEDRLAWRPHPTSRTLGTLAQHVATLPGMVAGFLAEESLDFGTLDRTEPEPASKAVLLGQHAASREAIVSYLRRADDELLASAWTLDNRGEEALNLPRAAVIRSFLLSHLIHHRGQLTVYLRMLEVPVPSIYGPSRDEMPAFLAATPPPGG